MNNFKSEYQALEERNKRLNEICQRFINEVSPLISDNNTDCNIRVLPVFHSVQDVVNTLTEMQESEENLNAYKY